MKVGIIADGYSEVLSLHSLCNTSGIQIKVIRADLQPLSNPNRIAKQAENGCMILHAKGYEHIVLLLDREMLSECPGTRAESVRKSIFSVIGIDACVVIKNRTYENWLIADPESIRSKLPKRFCPSQRQVRQVVPNKADNIIDARRWLDKAAIGSEYHKTTDVKKIAEAAQTESVAANSRSFRRFLRAIGYPTYASQSRRPK